MTAQAAFTQAGYKAPQNAPRLRNDELVAKRIEELQARNERKAEMAALIERRTHWHPHRNRPRSPDSFARDAHGRWPQGRRDVGQDVRLERARGCAA